VTAAPSITKLRIEMFLRMCLELEREISKRIFVSARDCIRRQLGEFLNKDFIFYTVLLI